MDSYQIQNEGFKMCYDKISDNKVDFPPTIKSDEFFWGKSNLQEMKDEDAKRLKWDLRFLDLAKFISKWSRDPSTQTGAVIVDSDNRIVSVGYNGFPKGVDDSEERYNNRELKYKIIVHCERNALLFANRSCKNCTLYTFPFMSCAVCASMVIQSGIKRCVAPANFSFIPKNEPNATEPLKNRWKEEVDLATQLFKEARVELVLIKEK